ncbi:chymotrypsinogen A-like [Lutzomyia longipalpis]|uniref:chymotrypsinogen A-like n=1 Tax=Lutzomyia longipalpis TaxID=7200 RepID=UPI0024837616|nr:chymotrypsinogen A-like [Lutzomyia longipalpis]
MEIPRGTYLSDTRPLFESRIVNGQLAELGQFPYQVFFTGYRDDMRSIPILTCGAVIIAERWIVTAAHCLFEDNNLDKILGSFVLKAGQIYTNKGSSYTQGATVLTAQTHPHPDYNPTTLMNDIGLFHPFFGFDLLRDPCYVNAIALPSPNDFIASHVGEELTISGFGRTATDEPASERLLWATLQVIPHCSCQESYAPTLPSTAFCGQDKTSPISSTCRGDSGGPVSLKIKNIPTLVGIVSFGGTNCGTVPQGFTAVANFVNWISEMQAKHK